MCRGAEIDESIFQPGIGELLVMLPMKTMITFILSPKPNHAAGACLLLPRTLQVGIELTMFRPVRLCGSIQLPQT